MENKYVMIRGFAFSEESDMNKLKNYAKDGWILESIVAGFFYRLKKDKPENIDYSLDYQSEATGEYFNLFKEAGWTLTLLAFPPMSLCLPIFHPELCLYWSHWVTYLLLEP